MYPQGRRYKRRSLGSGVLVDRRGYIITNAHVVRRASQIRVSLLDKRVYTGKLISANPKLDLAVVKIGPRDDLPTVEMGRSNKLFIGETVIAVGNPFGYAHTVTTGVLSAKDRTIRVTEDVKFEGLLQTDASINPGNSGGALLDVNGKLIGICTAIRARAEGIGFAIPVDKVRLAMVDLLDFRRVRRTHIGMGLVPVMNRRTGERVGLRVNAVEADGPAAAAGLKVNDVITKIDGESVVDVVGFEIPILEKRVGQQVIFDVLRRGSAALPTGQAGLKVSVTLGRLPMPDVSELIRRRTGLVVKALDKEAAAKQGLLHGGVQVVGVSPRTPAAEANLRTGDVILMFDNYRISRPEDMGALLKRLPLNARIVVVLTRKGSKYYAWMTVR